MSALTKNQVIALVMAVIANLFFFWSGIEYILSFCRLFLPDTFIDMIASLSFISHFNSTVSGLIELRDVIFFASVIIFGNYTTVLIVNYKKFSILHSQFSIISYICSMDGFVACLFRHKPDCQQFCRYHSIRCHKRKNLYSYR